MRLFSNMRLFLNKALPVSRHISVTTGPTEMVHLSKCAGFRQEIGGNVIQDMQRNI